MKDSINSRIRELIFLEDLNVSSFSRKVGLSGNSIIHNIINNEDRKPSFQVIESILEAFPELRSDWLLRGTGAPYAKSSETVLRPKGDPGLLTEFQQLNEYMRQLTSHIVRN